MLDGRKECVPGYEDSSGGCVSFSTTMRLKTSGPGSSTFDSLDCPYDKDNWVKYTVEELEKEFEICGKQMLTSTIEQLFDKAKLHCDEHHKNVRLKFKDKNETTTSRSNTIK